MPKKDQVKTMTIGALTIRSCYNCGSKDHISPQCPKPRREKGACYECGAMDHQIGACPTRKKRFSDDGKPKSAILMNIDLESDSGPTDEYSMPYEVQCELNVPVDEKEECYVRFNVVVDTGSPLNENDTVKETVDSRNEILCIDFNSDVNVCKDTVNLNPDLDCDVNNEFINIYNVEYLARINVEPYTVMIIAILK
ncbi:Transposon Ty3-I Gag-Pol polyprotein [Aphis craccivora]|uniref:Transposon Ty3-I Gag-Pol polyprotein n=1 Tax=Aphis craccivora TaxID=307492 RepID=A0A6G0XZW8_APHCR|nr:Transposon Ty3-I Gag-Pol polyprotein [Aphis craccivora]